MSTPDPPHPLGLLRPRREHPYFAHSGGLVSYGPDVVSQVRRALRRAAHNLRPFKDGQILEIAEFFHPRMSIAPAMVLRAVPRER
jgi:hypothetical protein